MNSLWQIIICGGTVSKIVPPSQMFCFGFHLLKELTTMWDGCDKSCLQRTGNYGGLPVAYVRWERAGNTQILKIVWKDNFEASESVALWKNADHVSFIFLSLQGKSDLKYACMIMRFKIFSIFWRGFGIHIHVWLVPLLFTKLLAHLIDYSLIRNKKVREARKKTKILHFY